MPPPQTNRQHPRPIHCKQRTDPVELRREYLEHYERKRELRDCCADVGPFEGALCGAYFDEFGGREDYAAGAVQAEVVLVAGVGLGVVSI